MSPRAHPSEETLVRFAAGTLPAGPRLVVATHLEGCACCRRAVRAFEAVGGALMAAQDGLPLAPDAFSRVMARIEREGTGAVQRTDAAKMRPTFPALPGGMALPAALAGCAIGPLRPIAPGVRMGRVGVPGDRKANVMLLHIGAGRGIPDHTHAGLEFTQVLRGAYHDHRGRYVAGDLVEVDGEVDHAPVVDADGDCICLVAMEGALRFRGLLGVLLRPFV
ncbi:ChrR family anti-sigma-E factor [Xanthobacter pseudotagetidis]|uniref:ChrR family anti-sigma-E factor n=1 Tax=Xanthobacter pseudotagetidis TaxID=3119911 RepID=UPI0037293638